MSLPDDLILNAGDEVAIRQHLTLVALGKRPADLAIEVGRVFAVHSRHWLDDQEVIVSGRRIAFVGPRGSYAARSGSGCGIPALRRCRGSARCTSTSRSTHITPEFEAALVLPRGNTWTCEASHEFANVNGPRNTGVLAEGARGRLAAEGLHPARLGGAAERLGRVAAATMATTSRREFLGDDMRSPASTR